MIKLMFNPKFEDSSSERHEAVGLRGSIFDKKLKNVELVEEFCFSLFFTCFDECEE